MAHSKPSGLNSDLLPPTASPIQRACFPLWITSTAALLAPPPLPLPPYPQFLSDRRMWQPLLRPVDWVNLIGPVLANAYAWIGCQAMDTQRSQLDIPMVSSYSVHTEVSPISLCLMVDLPPTQGLCVCGISSPPS